VLGDAFDDIEDAREADAYWFGHPHMEPSEPVPNVCPECGYDHDLYPDQACNKPQKGEPA